MRSLSGWYIGVSLEHYRCHKNWITETKHVRIGNTVFFKHKYLTMPTITIADMILTATKDLQDALEGDIVEEDVASPDAETSTPTQWPYGDNHKVGVAFPSEKVMTPAGRELALAIWYPAGEPEEDVTPVSYLNLMQGNAWENVPIAPGGPWPHIVFSHGNQGIKEQSFFLTEHLARKGYIVVAPDHQHNTFLDYKDDKLPEVSVERPRDVSATIDRVLSPLPSDPEWLAGVIDADKIGITGHSFGGYTSLLVGGTNAVVPEELIEDCDAEGGFICALIEEFGTGPVDLSDPRVSASMPMAPAGYEIFTDEGLGYNAVPTLILAGSLDALTPLQSVVGPIYEGMPGPKYLWTVEGGDHFIFSDLCKIPGIASFSEIGDFEFACGPDNPGPHADLHPHMNDIAEAFFDLYLMDDESGLSLLTVEGAQAAHPTIQFTTSEEE